MSRMSRYFAIAVIAIFAAVISRAADKTDIPPSKWAAAEKNYVLALASENDGVRISAAEHLGRYQLRGSIDALITMLKTDKTERARIAAAFALIIMNEDTGVKAVEESSLYDGSDKVASFCTKLLELQTARSYIAVTE
jgi:HEAT repeat protein